ncbi:MAG: DUF4230 domain-containing protein [Erysipelotrichaceae bacterium]|nr:DUF4230 domain-containing protein [Erysipelotrichaceae bacterium]
MKVLDTLGKVKKAIGGIVAIVITIAVIFTAGVMYAGRNADPVVTSTALTQQLQEVSELAVMEYNYTKVGKFENSLTFNGWNIPLTKKSFLLTYAGELKAGVRMDQAEVEVQGKNITVLLPPVEILSNIIDENSIEVYDETKNIFNPISVEDYTYFATEQKERVADEAIENGLLSEAATKTQSTIRKYFNMIPEIKEDYNIEIKFKEITEDDQNNETTTPNSSESKEPEQNEENKKKKKESILQ